MSGFQSESDPAPPNFKMSLTSTTTTSTSQN